MARGARHLALPSEGTGTLSVDPLVIRDKASDVKAAFHLDPGTVKMRFAGTLSRSTIEKVVPIPVTPGQRIGGEMEAVLDRGKPARSTARGNLEANDLAIPWKPLAPLVIRGASLSAGGGRCAWNRPILSWDNIPFSLTGTAESTGRRSSRTSIFPPGTSTPTSWRGASFRIAAKTETGAPSMSESRDGIPRISGIPGPRRPPGPGGLRVTFGPYVAKGSREGRHRREGLAHLRLRGEPLRDLHAGHLYDRFHRSRGRDGRVDLRREPRRHDRLPFREGGFPHREIQLSARVAGKGTGDALVRSLRGPWN